MTQILKMTKQLLRRNLIDEKKASYGKQVSCCFYYERIVCDNGDPPWINNEIKKLINEENSYYIIVSF